MTVAFDPIRAVVCLGAFGVVWLLMTRLCESRDRGSTERAKLIRLLLAVSCAQLASEVYAWAMNGADPGSLASVLGSAALVCGACSLIIWGGYETLKAWRRRKP